MIFECDYILNFDKKQVKNKSGGGLDEPKSLQTYEKESLVFTIDE